jgi:hypothetical protein
LHAKVIWTPDGAIVGSANASSNGMPEDDDHTASLIEAGMYETSPKELAAIEKWFDALYGKARNIGKADLDAARSARAMRKRVFGIKPETTRKSRQSLLEALRDSPVEFSKQRIKLLLYKDPISKAEDRAAQKLQQENRSEVAKGLNINTAELRRLSWLSGDWKDMPKNTFLIEGHYNAGKLRNIHVVKSFDAIRSWPIQAAGRWETITFVLGSGYEGFDYQLTTKDKNAISAAANGLWKIGRGDNLARYVRLLDARPLLLAQG